MNNDNGIKLYNILLPLWLLIFLPSYLWLVLIPLNYIIDRVVLGASLMLGESSEKAQDVGSAIMFDPFSNLPGLLIVFAGIAVSAVCILFLDEWILRRTGLDPQQAKRSAIRLALITAPYLFLFPTRLLYEGGTLGL